MDTNVSSTVSLWANFDTLSQGGNVVLFEQKSGSPRYVIWFDNVTNTINFYPNSLKQSQAVNASQWYHIVATLDGTNARFYINGSEVGTALTYTQVNTNQILELGRNPNNNQYFNGKIDEIGIFNVALTASEVQSIYSATTTGKTGDLNTLSTPPVAWYRMGD